MDPEAILHTLRTTIVITDQFGTIVGAHGGVGRPLGYEPSQLVGRNALDFVAPADHQLMIELFTTAATVEIDPRPQPFPLHLIGPDGEVQVWDILPSGVDNEGLYVNSLVPRSEQHIAHEAVEKFIQGDSALDMAIAASDAMAKRMASWDPESYVLHRPIDDEVGGSDTGWLLHVPSRWTGSPLAAAIQATIDDPNAPWQTPQTAAVTDLADLPRSVAQAAKARGRDKTRISAVALDGINRLCFLQFSACSHLAEGNSQLAHRSLAEVLARALRDEQHRSRLERAARVDPLTGLANRAAFDDTVERSIDAGDTAVLYVDVNRLKTINDRWGHSAGDQALQLVANRIRTVCRPHDLIARVGGDEFVVLLNGAGRVEAESVVQRINAEMAAPATVAGRRVDLSVAVGVAVGHHRQTLVELIDQADQRMLADKPDR